MSRGIEGCWDGVITTGVEGSENITSSHDISMQNELAECLAWGCIICEASQLGGTSMCLPCMARNLFRCLSSDMLIIQYFYKVVGDKNNFK